MVGDIMKNTTLPHTRILYPVVNHNLKSIVCIIADISLEEFFSKLYKDYTYEYLAYDFNSRTMGYDEWLIVKSIKTNSYFAFKTGTVFVDVFPALYPDLTPAKFYFDIFPDFFQKKAPH